MADETLTQPTTEQVTDVSRETPKKMKPDELMEKIKSGEIRDLKDPAKEIAEMLEVGQPPQPTEQTPQPEQKTAPVQEKAPKSEPPKAPQTMDELIAEANKRGYKNVGEFLKSFDNKDKGISLWKEDAIRNKELAEKLQKQIADLQRQAQTKPSIPPQSQAPVPEETRKLDLGVAPQKPAKYDALDEENQVAWQKYYSDFEAYTIEKDKKIVDYFEDRIKSAGSNKEVAELKQKIQAFEQLQAKERSERDAEKERRELQEKNERVFSEASRFQEKHPEYHTQHQLPQIEKQYLGFMRDLKYAFGKATDEEGWRLVTSYLQDDPVVHRACEERHINPPVDLDKYLQLVELANLKATHGFESFEEAWNHKKFKSGVSQDEIEAAKREAANNALKAVQDANSEPTSFPASVAEGHTEVKQKMTMQDISVRLEDLTNRKASGQIDDADFSRQLAELGKIIETKGYVQT